MKPPPSRPASTDRLTIDAAPAPESMIPVDLDSLHLPTGARAFAIKVRGHSMASQHILPGDVVILEHGPRPEAGDIVAALVNGKTALGTYQRGRRGEFLRSGDADRPEDVPAGDLMIQGVLRMVVRESARHV